MNYKKWNVTVPYKISVPGSKHLYSLKTNTGRTIFGMCSNETAYHTLINSVKHSETILSIGKEHIDEL